MTSRRSAAFALAALVLVAACGGSASPSPVREQQRGAGLDRAPGERAERGRCRGRLSGLPRDERRPAGDPDKGVHRRRDRRQAGRGKALYVPAHQPYERIEPVADGLRRPRPGDRRPGRGRARRRHVHRLPPARGGALGQEHDQRHGPGRQEAAGRRDPAPGPGQDGRPRPGHDRQRRGRPAQPRLVLRSSPARRIGIRTPTCRTSRPTSPAPRQAWNAVKAFVVRSLARPGDDDRQRLRGRPRGAPAIQEGQWLRFVHGAQARRHPGPEPARSTP